MSASAVYAVVLAPFLGAAMLAAVPSGRVGAWINGAVSAITFLLACTLPWHVDEAGPWLRADALAAQLALLTAFVALTTAWYSLDELRDAIAAGCFDRRRLRLFHALYQSTVGATLLALLSDNPAVTWVAMEIATVTAAAVVALPRTAASVRAARRYLMVGGAGLALALFGTVLLYLAADPVLGPGMTMSWGALLAAASRCDAPLLNLAFAFLLLGYATSAGLAPLHAWLPGAEAAGPTAVSAVLAGSILNAALIVILRLRAVLAANATALAPGPPIMALGLFSLVLAACSLWRRRDEKRLFAFAAIGQGGVAGFAFGLGGPAAVFAGLLHMTLYTLTNASVFQCVGRAARLKRNQRFAGIAGLLGSHRPLGLTLAAGLVALSALPPFGSFSSIVLIATETTRRAPLLALPLGVGLVAGAWALVAALQSLCLGAPTPDHGKPPGALALAPVWVQLAITVVLGLAMPAAMTGWMTAIAAAAG